MKLSYFLSVGMWKKIQYVACVHSPYSLKKTFFFWKPMKTMKNWQFLGISSPSKNLNHHSSGLILVFHQNISKIIQKVQNISNFQKSPSRFCHPFRLLCTIAVKWHRYRQKKQKGQALIVFFWVIAIWRTRYELKKGEIYIAYSNLSNNRTSTAIYFF